MSAVDPVQEIEYLSEWPPPSKCSQNQSICLRSPKQKGTSDLQNPRQNHQYGNVAVKRLKCETRASMDNMSSLVISLITSNTDLMPDVMLSRWWKRKSDDMSTNLFPSESQREFCCNPRTKLHKIARLPEGQHILSQRIAYLQEKLSELESSPSEAVSSIHFNIASCYHSLSSNLGHTCSALEHAQRALDLTEGDGEIEWLVQQLVRQKDAEKKKLEKEKYFLSMGNEAPSLSMPEPVQVERRCATNLSLKEFIEGFALTRTPVVITGLIDHMTVKPWSLDYIKEVIGHKVAPLKRMVEGSVEWARLESAGECTIKDFIESLDTEQDLRYLFDWSLPLNCPDLASELSIPKYFANNFLQRAPEGSLYHDSWPSLFIAPAGITSELHVDAFGSNFWMALFEGRKRWIFFPPEDTPLLYPVYSHSTDATFQSNLSSPNFTLHPLLALTHPRECVLHPSEVLYVPAGCPHRVENLEKSLAISANFVDGSNFEQVKRELSANASIDEQAKQLLSVFNDVGFDVVMSESGCVLQSEPGNSDHTVGSESDDSCKRDVHEIENSTNCKCRSNKHDDGSLCIPWLQYKIGVC